MSEKHTHMDYHPNLLLFFCRLVEIMLLGTWKITRARALACVHVSKLFWKQEMREKRTLNQKE